MISPHLSALAKCSEVFSFGLIEELKGNRFPLDPFVHCNVFLKKLFKHPNFFTVPFSFGASLCGSEAFQLVFHPFNALGNENGG